MTVAADEGLHDLWVEGRAAGGDALDRTHELGHVSDAVLEQVADARGVVPDELEHVRRLEMLGEDEHLHGGVGAPDLGRRDEPVVGVAGRHAHVDDRDVGGVRAHFQPQLVGVGGPPDDLVARVHEQGADALPQEGVVVCHDDAQCGVRPFQRRGLRYSVSAGHENPTGSAPERRQARLAAGGA